MDGAVQRAIAIHGRHRKDTLHTVVAAVIMESPPGVYEPVVVTSGVKCLPHPHPEGAVRDMHAEVLAVKALRNLPPAAADTSSRLWLWISEAPCGDASMEFQREADREPMFTGPVLRGRSGYHIHGVTRTKPGRADAPATHCMSCSDKLARWAVLGVSEGVYLAGIVLHESIAVKDLWERVAHVVVPFYRPHPIQLARTSVQFESGSEATSAVAMVWFKGCPKPEFIVDGFRQGANLADMRPSCWSRYIQGQQRKGSEYSEAKRAFHAQPPFDRWLHKRS